MQTWLIYPDDLEETFRILDMKRHAAQRKEAFQVLRALSDITPGWKKHVVAKMWSGYEPLLMKYINICLDIWEEKGGNNVKMVRWDVSNLDIVYPDWWHEPKLSYSHTCNLVRKDHKYYTKYFPEADPEIPYYWPTKNGYEIKEPKLKIKPGDGYLKPEMDWIYRARNAR